MYPGFFMGIVESAVPLARRCVCMDWLTCGTAWRVVAVSSSRLGLKARGRCFADLLIYLALDSVISGIGRQQATASSGGMWISSNFDLVQYPMR